MRTNHFLAHLTTILPFTFPSACNALHHHPTRPIDSELAETLVGLRLNIPNKWWLGFRDGSLNQGKIAAITLGLLSSYYFQIELNDEPGAHYAMCYDSVLLYADDEQPGFSRLCLPSCCPGNPEDEVVRVRVPQKLGGWLTMTTPTWRVLLLTRRQLNSTAAMMTTR